MNVHPADDMKYDSCPVITVSKEHPPGHFIPAHQHNRSQFLYASAGVMTITTEDGIWVVPPLRGVWIPACTLHETKASGNLSIRSLYFKPEYYLNAPNVCCLVSVSPLLRELIIYAAGIPVPYPLGGAEERTMQMIIDQIQFINDTPLILPIPQDERLKKIFSVLSENPGDKQTLEEWGKKVGTTRRTLARLLQLEVGMSFRKWRQQIRIQEALRRLSNNESVTWIAMELGYDNPSAFISMFKEALGKTPGEYFSKD